MSVKGTKFDRRPLSLLIIDTYLLEFTLMTARRFFSSSKFSSNDQHVLDCFPLASVLTYYLTLCLGVCSHWNILASAVLIATWCNTSRIRRPPRARRTT